VALDWGSAKNLMLLSVTIVIFTIKISSLKTSILHIEPYKSGTTSVAIRGHWSVESNNWQLDVTFDEDRVQVKNSNQARIIGKLRCFSMNILRWAKT